MKAVPRKTEAAGLTYVVRSTDDRKRIEIDLTLAADKVLNQKLTITAGDHMLYDENATLTAPDLHTGTETTARTVKMDTEAPTASIEEIRLGTWLCETPISFKVRVFDDGSGVEADGITITAGGLTGEVDEAGVTTSPDGKTRIFPVRFDVPAGSMLDDVITLDIQDVVGNRGATVRTEEPLQVDLSVAQLSDYRVEKISGSANQNVVKSGDIISVSFDLHDRIGDDRYGSGIDPSRLILHFNESYDIAVEPTFTADPQAPADSGNGTYRYLLEVGKDFPIESLIDNQSIFFRGVTFSDIVGNSSTADLSDHQTGLRYFQDLNADTVITNLEFKSIGGVSREGESDLVNTGDIITVSFLATHPVQRNFKIHFNGEKTFEWDEPVSVPGTKAQLYRGTFVVPEDPAFDNKDIQITGEIADAAENTPRPIKVEGRFTYYAPLSSAILPGSLQFSAQNGVGTIAKAKDKVKLSFRTGHPVTPENLSIAGHPVEFTAAEDRLSFTAELTLSPEFPGLTDNAAIPFSFTLSDEAENTSHSVDHLVTSKVNWYGEIRISNLSVRTSNSAGFAKNGDVITVTFNTGHPTEIRNPLIAGVAPVVNHTDGMAWTLTYVVRDGVTPDQTNINFSATVGDVVGNTPKNITQADSADHLPIRYFAPLRLNNVVVSSTNANDGTRFAKNGDVIRVTFRTNHPAVAVGASIAGRSVSLTGSDGTSWSFSYQLSGGDLADETIVPFTFSVTDAAGNTAVGRNQSEGDVTNRITYYAPLVVDDTIMTANGTTPGFVGPGSTVTVISNLNHQASILSGLIQGRSVTGSSGSARATASYTFGAHDGGLREGVVKYEITYTDPAGNTASVRYGSDDPVIIYDGTPAKISLAPNLTGFTNESATFTMTFVDPHLDPNRISIRLNGVELITAADRARVSAGGFSKTFTLEEEGQYQISASAVDRAGNRSEFDMGARLTIDKTVPVITLANELQTPLLTVPGGFRIADYLTIDEEYIKEILVTMTDATGICDWDIHDPITVEGKKTISATVIDMAGNQSARITFDIYVDLTPPKLLVYEQTSDRYLEPGANEAFVERAELLIRTEELQLKGVEPDRLQTATLLRPDGTMIDLMKETPPDAEGNLKVTNTEIGDYLLTLGAVDSVGNATGPVSYEYSLVGKREVAVAAVTPSNTHTTPGWLWPLLGAIALVFLILLLLLLYKRRKSREEE